MTPDNPEDFRTLVRKMREAQRAYFRKRNQIDLYAAQGYEREVDAALGPQEPGLFDATGDTP